MDGVSGVHLLQSFEAASVDLQLIAATTAKVLANDHPHELQFLRMGCHRVCRNDPTALPQLMGDGKFIVLMLLRGVQAKRHKGKTLSPRLGQDDEPKELQGFGEVVGGMSQVPGRD